MGAAMADQIFSLRSEVQHAVKMLREDLAHQKSRKSRFVTIPWKVQDSSSVDVSALATSLIQSETSGTNMVVSLALLDSLTFEQMDFRHSKIHEAHPQTFAWMFENSFKRWLQSSEPIFWISGKPGSGKSTLMKYLVDNRETHILLRQRSGLEKQVVASYFFWINGTELQRSQEGLLQSLLYELLRQCPDLIEPALPDAWRAMASIVSEGKSTRYTWKRADLLDAFRRLATLDTAGTRFCIFIDGLDEYQGDHDELIDTIRRLTKMNVKMCVASRPWNVFEAAFGQDTDCKLYLQDLNKADIKLYVDDKLRLRPEFQALQISTGKADEIINEIIEKSQGVFLWVFLVVQSLIEGLRNHDRLSQLQKRLRDFPSDLHKFFAHIFRSLDPTYRIQTAHMFQVALAAPEPLSPLTYWFLDEAEDVPDIALCMPIRPLTTRDLSSRITEIKIRINGRCKGLLELTTTSSHAGISISCVDFLHRTVKDFFMTSEMQRTFANWQHQDFDPDFEICKASLAELKFTDWSDPSEVPSTRVFLRAAKEYESKHRETPMAYLEHLERTVKRNVVLPPKQNESYFLDIAITSDLLVYVRVKLNALSKSLTKDAKLELLHPLGNRSLEMICLILAIGPPLDIDLRLQGELLEQFNKRVLQHDAVLMCMKEMCKYSSFAMRESGDRFLSRQLDDYLRGKLSPAEMDEMVKANRPARMDELAKANREKRSPRNLFRKLLR